VRIADALRLAIDDAVAVISAGATAG